MTYADFLADCRKLAARKAGKEITREEFAKLCGSAIGKRYTGETIRNMEEGYKPPGRELLEAAARVAGIEFQDCIQLPEKPPVLSENDAALDIFTRALHDWRGPAALKAALDLATMKKPKRRKYGGRTRKQK